MIERSNKKEINWKSIRAVIFDVDGTLYDQRMLRKKMIKELFWYYIRHPGKIYELKILRDFRRAREVYSHSEVDDIEYVQYVWGAERSHVTPEHVRDVVEEWILKRPLKYLFACRYSGMVEFLSLLRQKGISVTFFSDYPVTDKLNALGLSSDLSVVATDPHIGRLKPDPKGVLYIARMLNIMLRECIIIGDRDDREGEIARKIGIEYVLIGRQGIKNKQNYYKLIAELNFQRPV